MGLAGGGREKERKREPFTGHTPSGESSPDSSCLENMSFGGHRREHMIDNIEFLYLVDIQGVPF